MKELVLKKCDSCGALVKVIKECHCACDIVCCESKMRELKANEVDASVEKHVPEYSVENDIVKVRVNHVMESDHYIEWICALSDEHEEYVYFNPGDEPVGEFQYYPNMKIYSYCNKHSLWMKEVE